MTTEATSQPARPPLALSLLRLARPHQWAKSVFVYIGPVYALTLPGVRWQDAMTRATICAVIFALASSACYVVNDLLDAEQDRAHPRKRNRPIASGAVTARQARIFAVALGALAAAGHFGLPAEARGWVALGTALYVVNVLAYSAWLKQIVIADVMSLSMGFVLRVLGGCAAAWVSPSVWLLNCTLFLAMFLAFGKRLGERRTLGAGASAARRVQGVYTDTFLEMAVVVTGMATLLGYTAYIAGQSEHFNYGFNLLWLTVLPATFALFRAIVLLDAGRFDDPTEMAMADRPFQVAALLFAALTAALLAWRVLGSPGG